MYYKFVAINKLNSNNEHVTILLHESKLELRRNSINIFRL